MNPAENRLEETDCVKSLITYMVPMDEKPRRYLCSPPPGMPDITWRSVQQPVSIYNGRASHTRLSLDAQGLVLRQHDTTVRDFYDDNEVRATYYSEVERMVKDLTGASAVIVFDHNVRSSSKAARSRTGTYPPARFAHADYTLLSGPQRVRDLLSSTEAGKRLGRRFMFLNMWRPIKGPVEDDALALCDAQSVDQSDLVATDLIYADRTGEIYNLTFQPKHRWYYFPRMRRDEALIFKCFDSSDRARANCVPHSSFHDPEAPADAAPRESIEARTVAFF
ncbi:MAG TPA: CmcJ/NvfI family oxidoreductase [Candidatus Binataceae bacterium]|nr:CmcJ/NvfI family oxidoreductase [Candidatus Binataceae bacterium]